MYEIYDVRCNGMRGPKGIMEEKVEFAWKLRSDVKGAKQSSCRVVVYDEDKVCVWDTGVMRTEKVNGVVYNGIPLSSHMSYYYEIKSCSNYGEEAVSEQTHFMAGMLEQNWKAKWIETGRERHFGEECTDMSKVFSGEVTSLEHPEEFLNPPVYFRKDFITEKKVKKAVAYATARGIYQLRINGRVVSDLFAPEYTSYPDYLEVQQYDITALLNEKEQAIGVILADGWYTGKIGLVGIGNQYGSHNAFYFQLELFYENGERETIISDQSFQWSIGDYDYADLFIGERYCQGRLDVDWQKYGFCGDGWEFSVEKDYGVKNFKGRKTEPVRILRRQPLKNIFISPKGELILDAGENIVGGLHIRMRGTAGNEVSMIHSEVLDQNGNFLMNIIGQNKNQTDVIVCSKDGEIEYEPYFTFHGFQYVKVEGIEKGDILEAEVFVIGSDLLCTGTFECSDSRINQLQKNIFRSQQGNMLSVPTDCPQRERAGWTGDMQVYAPTACFNMDMLSFLEKWLINMRYEQLPDGQIQNIVPMMDSNKYMDTSNSPHVCSAAWGDACIILPYTLYWKYGNEQVLWDNFSMMEKWMNYVENQASTSFLKPVEEYTKEELKCQKYLWNTEFHFGDWLFPSGGAPFETAYATKEYTSPAMFAYTSGLMSEICGVLGKTQQRDYYKNIQDEIRVAYHKVYIDDQGKLPVQYQGVYVLALWMELFPAPKKHLGMKHLVQLIRENDNCLDTGFASIGYLLDTLYENGERELAYQLLFQTKCPSWLYEVEMGATTIWERWNAILPDGTRTNASYNHFAFGCVGDFIYRRIGGLYAQEPGYKRVRIEPDIDCGLTGSKLCYESIYGKINIEWKITGEHVFVWVNLPPNITGVLKVKDWEQEIVSGCTEIKIKNN